MSDREFSRLYHNTKYVDFAGLRREQKPKTEEELHGTDWESVNYSLTKLQCNEDEITGLAINDKYLVVQYHIEGGIDVYDRSTLKHLFRLQGMVLL